MWKQLVGYGALLAVGTLALQWLDYQRVVRTHSSDILLFGSPTATHALMELNLIDGYWLFVNPIVLGQGIPLFQGIQEKATLKLLSSRAFSSGVVELNYIADK